MNQNGFALITGASGELGMAFARELAGRHHNRILVAHPIEPLSAFASKLRQSKRINVLVYESDLCRPGAGQRLAAQLACRDVSIDLLVNNAGFGMRGEFQNLSHVRQLEMLRLNNEAVVELTYSLLPAMLRRPQRGIINVSSTAGFQPIPFASVYSATKAFVTTFSLALEQELLGAGVTVCPGRLGKNQNGDSKHLGWEKWTGVCQSTETVGRDALRVRSNGGGLTVPGALNKLSVFAQRLTPRKLVPRMMARMSRA